MPYSILYAVTAFSVFLSWYQSCSILRRGFDLLSSWCLSLRLACIMCSWFRSTNLGVLLIIGFGVLRLISILISPDSAFFYSYFWHNLHLVSLSTPSVFVFPSIHLSLFSFFSGASSLSRFFNSVFWFSNSFWKEWFDRSKIWWIKLCCLEVLLSVLCWRQRFIGIYWWIWK